MLEDLHKNGFLFRKFLYINTEIVFKRETFATMLSIKVSHACAWKKCSYDTGPSSFSAKKEQSDHYSININHFFTFFQKYWRKKQYIHDFVSLGGNNSLNISCLIDCLISC